MSVWKRICIISLYTITNKQSAFFFNFFKHNLWCPIGFVLLHYNYTIHVSSFVFYDDRDFTLNILNIEPKDERKKYLITHMIHLAFVVFPFYWPPMACSKAMNILLHSSSMNHSLNVHRSSYPCHTILRMELVCVETNFYHYFCYRTCLAICCRSYCLLTAYLLVEHILIIKHSMNAQYCSAANVHISMECIPDLI